jgi:hypothetical protein
VLGPADAVKAEDAGRGYAGGPLLLAVETEVGRHRPCPIGAETQHQHLIDGRNERFAAIGNAALPVGGDDDGPIEIELAPVLLGRLAAGEIET